MVDKISGLCISHPSRYGLLQRAIYNFLEQHYENTELVVLVSDRNYHALMLGWLRDKRHPPQVLERLKSNVILRHVADTNLSQMATYGIALCSGDYIVVWDDDNLSHPDRLASQLEQSREYPSVFSKSLYYFYDSEELYVTDYSQPGGDAEVRCATSSLMFHRRMFPPLDTGRHSAGRSWNGSMVALFASSFPEQQYTHIQDTELCFLFMQGSTGDNFRGQQFHRKQGSDLPATWTREQILSKTSVLEEVIKGYRFSNVEKIDVAGKDAAACSISDDIKGWPNWFHPELPPANWEQRIPDTPEWNESKSAS
jgi:glycosyltransferase involved in cell wall biosynthesis